MIAGFLAPSGMNSLSVQVCGKGKREVGLVVPAYFHARTKSQKFGNILSKEIKDIIEHSEI